MSSPIRAYTNRPPASRKWESTYKWGSLISDSTDYVVSRVADGAMTIRVGKESVEIRADMVATVAQMVEKAAAWQDEQEATR